MRDVVLGIDPGLSGGVVAFAVDTGWVCGMPMPVLRTGKRRDVDGRSLGGWILGGVRDGQFRVRLAVVEAVHSMPKQGMASTFAFGVGFGRVLGVIEALDLPLELVSPKAWKKVVLAGTDQSKDAAVAYCLRRFPDLDLPAKGASRHGIAEAACLAEYGRRLILQGG